MILTNTFQGPLNARINGGSISWEGEGTWEPQLSAGVCVDWRDEVSLVYVCDLSASDLEWNLVGCKQTTTTSCP